MKYVFSLVALVFSTQPFLANAEDAVSVTTDRILICSPSPSSRNGINLAWARIEMSRENPEATLYYRISSRDPRRARKTFSMHYDSVGDGRRYELIPDSRDPGAMRIDLKKIGPRLWESTFMNGRTDTISILPCSEGESSPVRG